MIFKQRPDEITGIAKIVRVFTVTVTGEAPKIAGWAFAAVLQPTVSEEGTVLGNLLRVVPGFDAGIPEQYRTAGNNCDHCHTARRRNETFVLVSESGEWKQVGRQCLRDFLGHQSPEAYATWAEILIDAADFAGLAEESDISHGGSDRWQVRYEAEEILALGASCIRLYGFLSNKSARDFNKQSTSGAVSAWLDSNREQRKEWEKPLVVVDEDKALAAEVFAWMQSLGERSDLNDYFYNLSLLGKGATFTAKNFGLVISAIAVFAREKEREINRNKRFAEDQNSQYVGEIGKRSTFENLTLVYTQTFESDWGVSTLYKFKDAAGNIIVWFASGSNPLGLEVNGQPITLVASVKKHEEREGIKQTTITRAKVPTPPAPKPSKEEKQARKADSMMRNAAVRLQNEMRQIGSTESDGEALNILWNLANQFQREAEQLRNERMA